MAMEMVEIMTMMILMVFSMLLSKLTKRCFDGL